MQDEVPPDLLYYGAGLLVLSGGLHVVLRLQAKYADPVLLPAATLLNGLGLVMIHRLDLAHPQSRTGTNAYALRQLVWSAIGVVGAILVHLGDQGPPGPAPLHLHRDGRRPRPAGPAAAARPRQDDQRLADLDRVGAVELSAR